MALLALVALAACDQRDPPISLVPDNGMKGLQVSVLNYTDEYIDVVYINGSWAANMVAHSGGGSFSAHAAVPKQWNPNFTLTVRWRDEPLYRKDPAAYYERELTTQPYQ